ncbi:hypothetical protein BDB01DRAFT_761950 [Pilobolus umbonatus]|nr:hypothetical protein BDB01DRAFT_761950 [Pilobolus umbonatus]
MPFRCKCGRTFEKTDTFASHAFSCAPFHHRRLSDTSQLTMHQQQQHLPFINTSLSFSGFLSHFFMPTALSIQNAFEGARRRSMSYGSTLK